MAGHTATFSSADLGMKTENAEKMTRRYEGGSEHAQQQTQLIIKELCDVDGGWKQLLEAQLLTDHHCLSK